MKAWVGCLLGILIGSGGLLAWQRLHGSDSEFVAAQRQVAEAAQARTEALEQTAESRRRIAELAMVNAELSRRLNQQAPGAASSTPPGASATEGAWMVPPSDEGTMRTMQRRFAKDQAERWKRRLQLTMAQEQLVDRALAEDLKSLETRPAREFSEAKAFRQELERVLTPEQKAKYDAVRQREKQEHTDLNARVELSQIEQAVEITDAQRQAILQKMMARNPMDDMPPPDASDEGASRDPLAPARAFMDRRIERLEGILTPAQLEEYRDHLSAQLDQIETMMKSRPSPTPPPER